MFGTTKAILVAIVVMLATSDVEARVVWPWERAPSRHHVWRGHSAHEEIVPPNCQQINEAVKALDPDRFERALRSSSKRQREIIAACQENVKP